MCKPCWEVDEDPLAQTGEHIHPEHDLYVGEKGSCQEDLSPKKLLTEVGKCSLPIITTFPLSLSPYYISPPPWLVPTWRRLLMQVPESCGSWHRSNQSYPGAWDFLNLFLQCSQSGENIHRSFRSHIACKVPEGPHSEHQ